MISSLILSCCFNVLLITTCIHHMHNNVQIQNILYIAVYRSKGEYSQETPLENLNTALQHEHDTFQVDIHHTILVYH